MLVSAYEDPLGGVAVGWGDQVWDLGTDTTDPAVYGRFAGIAAAIADSEWEPNENDGQRPTTLDGLVRVAVWDDGEMTVDEAVITASGTDFVHGALPGLEHVRVPLPDGRVADLRMSVEGLRALAALGRDLNNPGGVRR